MKRYLTVLVIMSLTLALVGCGAKSSKPEPGSEPTAMPVETEAEDTEQAAAEEDLPSFTRETLPVMDGSTSLAPLGTAVAAKLLGESEEDVADLISFNKTTQSYRNLMWGECQLLLASEPNAAVFDEAEEQGFSFDMEAISTEALVFVVNAENPVDNLTTEQIRGIYSGEITNWKEVGGEDLPIRAFQRNSGSGSQALMEKLVMGDLAMAEAPTEYLISSMGELMEAVRSYDNSADAIGYSVYYYANDMRMADGLKIISVDGVEPQDETIRSGKYPHTNAYYCVINAAEEEGSPARILYDWMVSPSGQKLVAEQGYVSVMDLETIEREAQGTLYTRKSEDTIPNLTASDDYGAIYPFIGSVLYSSEESGYSGVSGYLYGMMDGMGCIIADPTYASVKYASAYDYNSDSYVYAPYWLLGRCEKNPNSEYDDDRYLWRYTIASVDGSYVSAQDYGYYQVGPFGLMLADAYGADSFIILGEGGKVIFDSDQMPWKDRICEETVGSISYSEDLFIICLSDGYYYMDLQGNLVLGPYGYAEGFHQGRAAASASAEERCGVIDSEGRWIIASGTYDSIGDFGACGLASAYLWDEDAMTVELIDLEGHVLKSLSGEYSLTVQDNGYEIDNYDESKETAEIYDAEGNLLKTLDIGTETTVYDTNLIYSQNGDQMTVKNLLTGAELTLDDAENLGIYGVFKAGSEEMDTDNRLLQISNYASDYYTDVYDPNTLEKLLDHSQFVSLGEDPFTGQCWLYRTVADNKVEVYKVTFDGAASLEQLCSRSFRDTPAIYNQLMMVTDDQSCTWMDLQGNVIFKYSLLQSYDD